MARQPLSFTDDKVMVGARICDSDGNPMIEIFAEEYVLNEPDGTSISKKINQSLALVCGDQWHPGMMDVRLVVCDFCRHPPYRFPVRAKARHGLLNKRNARRCSRCNITTCPAHSTRIWNGYYCPSCAWKLRIRAFLRKIFFSFEKE